MRRLTDGAVSWEAFDDLVIATGASPVRPNLPGGDADGIYGLAILEDGIRVRAAVDRDRPQQAVIVGGGYIGLEMAEALVMRGLQVALVERGPAVMGTLDRDMGDLVSQALRDVGVTVYLEESVEGFETRDGAVAGVRTDRRILAADLVILGIGTRPNAELAAAAGVPLGETGAIKINDRMQTGAEGVWAAGDCAEAFHLVCRRPVNIALGTIANKQGRICGINLGGGYATFPGVVGTAVSKICALEVAHTGPNESEAAGIGLQYVVGKIEGTTRASYFPGAGRITVKVLAKRGSGRLLGAQIVGVVRAAESADRPRCPAPTPAVRPSTMPAAAVTHAARVLAEAIGAVGIAAVTRGGRTAHLLSGERPRLPVYAFSPDAGVCRRLALWWGVVPIHQPLAIDEMLSAEAMGKHLVRTDAARLGDRVVVVGVHDQAGEGPARVVVHLVLGASE